MSSLPDAPGRVISFVDRVREKERARTITAKTAETISAPGVVCERAAPPTAKTDETPPHASRATSTRADTPTVETDETPSLGEPAPWRCFACRRGSPVEHGPGWWRCSACGVQIGRPWTTPPRLVFRWRDGDPTKAATGGSSGPVTVRWSSDLRGWLAIRNPNTGELVEIPYRDAPDVWKAAVRRAR